MNLAIQKTISLILLIVIGLLLKKKIKNKEQLGGVKVLILSIALPATIFIALLKIEIEPTLLFLPVLALLFNLAMYFASGYLLPFFGIAKGTPTYRTLLLLVPSLAPGLSCFPFLIEYLGEDILARAALADVGNKVFVLIILYLVAMHFFYQNRQKQTDASVHKENRLKGLLLSLVREPVNLVIVTALILLGFGFNLQSLPFFIQDPILRMSALMTPMVLLFIGMAVKFNRKEFSLIFQILLWRSGLAFLISGIFLLIVPALSVPMALLVVVFPQSASSFWPFAHMSAVATLESKQEGESTFQLDFALNVLALSLPLSTVIILAICSIGSFFANPYYILLISAALLGTSGLLIFLRKRTERSAEKEKIKQQQPAVLNLELQEK